MDVKEVIETWRPEILGYLKEMRDFYQEEDCRLVLRTLSAYSARASYMRNFASRSGNEKINRFRIDELDPFLMEVDRQFKIYSRLISANQFEFDLTK